MQKVGVVPVASRILLVSVVVVVVDIVVMGYRFRGRFVVVVRNKTMAHQQRIGQ